MFLILVPRNIYTYWVTLHLPVERIVGGHGVEELPPDQLGHDGVGGGGVRPVHLVPGVHHAPVKLLYTDAAKF